MDGHDPFPEVWNVFSCLVRDVLQVQPSFNPSLQTSDPDWASYKLGVFVCLNCSGVHRNLSSKVKSIKLDFWEDSLVQVKAVPD